MAFKMLQAVTLLCLASEIACLSCIDLQKVSEKECFSADMRKSHNGNYIHCVKTRMKRHQNYCDNEDNYCHRCSCESCSYNKCEGQCEPCCHSCCANYVECHTNHCCHEQCRYECGNSNCRSNCRESCYQSLRRNQYEEKPILVQQPVVDRGSIVPSSNQNQETSVNNNNNLRNITTVINVKNVVNSTNFLNLPINMTSINRNNITVREMDQNGQGSGTKQDCCIVIGPKQCIPTQISPYTRCFHTRSRQCGSYCSASIVHQETRQVCDTVNSYGQPANCQQQVTYIPQPQPRCVYTSTWPYVSCGIQPSSICEGCYLHYFNAQAKQYKSCPPQCYDNFSMGPLYRQGPYYQPSYTHSPPCAYSPQGCGGDFAGYGLGGGTWPGLGPYGAGGAQFGQGFGAANMGFSPFLPAGLPRPFLDGFPNVDNPFNWTMFNTSVPGFEAPNPVKLVEEYQNDMPFMPISGNAQQELEVQQDEPNKYGQQNDTDITVVNT